MNYGEWETVDDFGTFLERSWESHGNSSTPVRPGFE